MLILGNVYNYYNSLQKDNFINKIIYCIGNATVTESTDNKNEDTTVSNTDAKEKDSDIKKESR